MDRKWLMLEERLLCGRDSHLRERFLEYKCEVKSHIRSTRCETSPHTCTPTISPTSVSLFHMVDPPSSGSHFYPQVFYGRP